MQGHSKEAPGNGTHKSDSLKVNKAAFDGVLGNLLTAQPAPLDAIKTPRKRSPTPILEKK